jgi:hypothetical protein
MPTITLIGRVLPETINVNVSGLELVNWPVPEAGLDVAIQIEIAHSKVTAVCTANRFDPAVDFMPIYIRAFDLARAAADLVGFAEGRPLMVVFDSVVDPTGEPKPVRVEQPAFARYVTAFGLNRNLSEVWKVIVEDPAIFQALNDLVACIALPHHGPINAARVVEGLSHTIGGVGAKPQVRWNALRDALNVDKDFLQQITDLSAEPRHGNRTHIPGIQVDRVVTRAWMIMNRFLEYKLRGGVPLPTAEFPLLVGRRPD